MTDGSPNVMDRWILSFTQSLLLFMQQEMAAYRLYTVVPRLVRFADHLTNWYVRMNRKRLKGDTGKDDCHRALQTVIDAAHFLVEVILFNGIELLFFLIRTAVQRFVFHDPRHGSVHAFPDGIDVPESAPPDRRRC